MLMGFKYQVIASNFPQAVYHVLIPSNYHEYNNFSFSGHNEPFGWYTNYFEGQFKRQAC